MHKLTRPLGLAALALLLGACHIAYVPDVQQGNLFDKTIDKNLAEQLKPGLTKRQVLVLLGTPSVASPFDHERWDYVSTYSRRGAKPTITKMTLFFNNDVLVRTEGTLYAQSAQDLVRDSKKYHSSYPTDETQGDKSDGSSSSGKDGGSGGSGS